MSRKDSSHSIEIVLYYQLTCIFFQKINYKFVNLWALQ